MAIFGYGRVSTADQTTENQRLEIERSGYMVEYWYADTVSGKVPAGQRPEFARLIDRIRDGETLIVSKLDRLGRDASDIAATLRTLSERKIEVIVLQLGKMDITSPIGKMMIAMLSALAEMERDLLIERTQAGLARARAQGIAVGRPAATTVIQQRDIRDGKAKGLSVSALARAHKISRQTVNRVLNKHFDS